MVFFGDEDFNGKKNGENANNGRGKKFNQVSLFSLAEKGTRVLSPSLSLLLELEVPEAKVVDPDSRAHGRAEARLFFF